MTRLPDASSSVTDSNGRLTTVWREALSTLFRGLAQLERADEVNLKFLAAKAQTFAEPAFIEFPDNKDYLFAAMGFDGAITQVVAECESGTCDLTVLIGDQEINEEVISISDTRTTSEYASNNTLSVGSDVTLRISNNAAATSVSITLIGTRTLA